MEKIDLRIGRTQKLLQDAFLDLMREEPFEEITVAQIAEKAMINRKTFYAHYGTKQQLYDAMALQIIDALCETMMYLKKEPTKELDADILEEDARAFIEVLEQYKEEFLILLNPRINYVWYPILENVIISKRKSLMLRIDTKEEKTGEVPFKLYLDMITSQMVIWIYWWLSQEDYSVEDGAHFICRLMTRSMANVLRYVKPPKVIHSKNKKKN